MAKTLTFKGTLLALVAMASSGSAFAADYKTVAQNSSDNTKQDVTYTFADRSTEEIDNFKIDTTKDPSAYVYASTEDTNDPTSLYALTGEDLERFAFSSNVASSATSGSWWWRSTNSNSGYTHQDGINLRRTSSSDNQVGGFAILDLKAGDKVKITGIAICSTSTSTTGYTQFSFPGASSQTVGENTTDQNPKSAEGEATYTVTFTDATDSNGYGYIEINVTSDGYVAAYVKTLAASSSNNYAYIHSIVITEALEDETDTNTYNYTVNAVDESGETIAEIASGTSGNGTVTVSYPYIVLSADGTIYYKNTTNGSVSVTINGADATATVTYSEYTSIADATGAFAKEGEDFLPSKTTGTDWYAGAYGVASSTEKNEITTLKAGNYKIATRLVTAGTFKFVDGNDNEICPSLSTTYAKASASSDIFTLTEETTIYLTVNNEDCGLDYLLIAKLPDNYEKTIPSYNLVSFSAAYNVSVPEGVSVYAATAVGADAITLTLKDVSVISANTGVILYSEQESISLPLTTTSGSSIEGNLLTPSSSTPTLGSEGDGYIYYGLKASNETETPVFAQIANGTTLSGNKAYLKTSASTSDSSGAKSLKITFGEATGIEIIAAKTINDGAFYNLQGVRVENPSKGLYIQNGKKVIIK